MGDVYPNRSLLLGSQTGAASTLSPWWKPTMMSTRCCSAGAPRAKARTSAWPPSTVGIIPHQAPTQGRPLRGLLGMRPEEDQDLILGEHTKRVVPMTQLRGQNGGFSVS